jgi:YD repeat-containing protein
MSPGAKSFFLQSWVYDDLGHVASETYPDCSFPACTGNLNSLSGANGRNIPVAPQTNRLNAPGTTYDAAGNLTTWRAARSSRHAADGEMPTPLRV